MRMRESDDKRNTLMTETCKGTQAGRQASRLRQTHVEKSGTETKKGEEYWWSPLVSKRERDPGKRKMTTVERGGWG